MLLRATNPVAATLGMQRPFLARLSLLINRNCPRSLTLLIVKFPNFILTAHSFSFRNHFRMSTVSFISSIACFFLFFFGPFFGMSRGSVPGNDSTASVSSALRSRDLCSQKRFLVCPHLCLFPVFVYKKLADFQQVKMRSAQR